MKGAFRSLFDGQWFDFKSASRPPSSSQTHIRTRTATSDVFKWPSRTALGRNNNLRSFPVRSSLEDASGISQDERLHFREELIEFAKNAPTMKDPKPFHDAVTPEAKGAMKYIISRMLGSVSHQFFDIRYSSITAQCETLCLSILISGYMIKNAQDRMDLTKRFEDPFPPTVGAQTQVLTHGVEGDVVKWKRDNCPESIPAQEYIAQLEAELQELKQRERERFLSGDADPVIEYMKSLDNRRMEELANGASEEVLLAMHVVTEEFLGDGNPDAGPTTCSLPQKEMSRLMEWLMMFGYNLRCKEVKHDMERAFQMDSAPPSEHHDA